MTKEENKVTASEEAQAELLSDPQQLEAPAEAGDDDGDIPWPDTALSNALHKHFSDLHGLDNEEASEEVYGVLDVLKALRAQPPAREDEQPWGYGFRRKRWGDAWSFSRSKRQADDILGYSDGEVQPLYTHPATGLLRVAVEALEPFAEIAGRYLAGGMRADLEARSPSLLNLIEPRDFYRARTALAALQAESIK